MTVDRVIPQDDVALVDLIDRLIDAMAECLGARDVRTDR